MVNKFLKIAGVKTEADFYKKYPSEAAFFKAHPEAKDLKQYKQGGQMKKLNQLTNWTNDVDNIIPIAQYGCKGKSCTQTGDGIKKVGVRDQPSDKGSGSPESYVRLSNAPTTWEELQTYNETNPKDKDFKNRLKSLQGQFPGLTQQQMLAAGADSARIRQRMTNLPRYDQPSEQTYDRAYHMFYRPLMNQPTPVTIPQILQYQSQQPGGLQGYESTVRGNYNRPKAQVGTQLDMWGNPVQQNITQMPTNPNAGTGQMGLNNPAGGTMQLQPAAAATNAANQLQMWGTGADITQGGTLGGKTPDAIKGVASEMSKKTGALGKLGGIGGIMQTAGTIASGIQEAKEEKKLLQQSKQQKAVSDLTLQASQLRPEKVKRKYVRPEDAMFQPDQLSPSYGVGTNYLAENGTMMRAQNGFMDSLNNPQNILGRDTSESTFIQNPYIRQISTPMPIMYDLEKLHAMEQAIVTDRPIRRDDIGIDARRIHPTSTGWKREGGGRALVNRNGGMTNMQIGGNLTEIQNMYNPGDLYSDLGYEPLNDADRVKQYYYGGGIPQAQSGFVQSMGQYAGAGGADQASQLFGGLGSAIGGSGFKQNAGSKIGGGIGKTAGSLIGGPIGGLIGGAVGGLAGGLIDQKGKKIAANQEATQQNLQTAAFNSGAQALQNQYSSFMREGGLVPYEEGGWVSHDWQPQVITTFGEHKMSDLLRPDPSMDTLRTGGHITQNNMYPQDRYALGGELKTTWGGYAEPMSHNPYMPGSGETVMFRGKSHDETNSNGQTGIGVKYGEGGKMSDYAEYGTEQADADVEVEKGEPAAEMIDPETGDKNMVVWGNLKIPNQFLSEIGDPKAKGKKFKNYIADLAKQEAKHNKTIEKNLAIIDSMDDITSFDQMRFLSANANINGANMKLKGIADKKINTTSVQNAINEAAEEHGLDADALSKGKFKMDKNAMNEAAKWGKTIRKAQNGDKYKIKGQQAGSIDYNPIEQSQDEDMWKTIPNYEKIWKPKVDEALSDSKRADDIIKSIEGYTGQDAKDVINIIKKQKTRAGKIAKIQELGTDFKVGPYHNILNQVIDQTAPKSTPVTPPVTVPDVPQVPGTPAKPPYHYPITPYKGSKLMDAYGQILPYIRPTNQEPLDPTQMYGEMYALSTNQQDPVQAKLYNPLLEQPYDISLQDQLNANQSDFNAIQRQTGYNPSATATLAAQKYAANSNVLGNQFRANQENRAGAYNRNRGTLNDAQLKNLGILDQQMVRQATAKSRTKEVGQAALNSISDKIMKQKLANRTLGVYENLYNYRFDKQGRAINMNAPYQPNIPNVLPVYDNQGNIVGYQQTNNKTSNNKTSTAPNVQQQLATVNAANTAQDQGYIPLPPVQDFSSDYDVMSQQKKGGKTPARNRDILRAMKNL